MKKKKKIERMNLVWSCEERSPHPVWRICWTLGCHFFLGFVTEDFFFLLGCLLIFCLFHVDLLVFVYFLLLLLRNSFFFLCLGIECPLPFGKFLHILLFVQVCFFLLSILDNLLRTPGVLLPCSLGTMLFFCILLLCMFLCHSFCKLGYACCIYFWCVQIFGIGSISLEMGCMASLPV